MDDQARQSLRTLLATQDVAALATLHERRDGDDPAVSMVPLAWLPGTADALIHISSLAAHTRDLQRRPRAALLLMAPRRAGDDALALPRLSLQTEGEALDPASPEHGAAQAVYAARFASATQTLALGDFALWRLRTRSARWVAGFGRAMTLTPDQLAAVLADLR